MSELGALLIPTTIEPVNARIQGLLSCSKSRCELFCVLMR